MNKKAFLDFTYGLFVLSSAFEGRRSGCIINTAGQVTTDPERISICVNKGGFTHDLVMKSGKFNISIIDEDAPFDLFRRFGFQSGRDVNKFRGYPYKEKAENDIYYVTEGTNAYMSAEVEMSVDLGTHTLFIARVTAAEVLSDVRSASYSYYHEHIKPRPKAEEKKEGRVAWRCTVCGYIYDNPDLPEDFICPICKHPASDFEKIYL